MRGRKTTGYLWKRGINNRHLPHDSTIRGQFYFTWIVNNKKRTKCLDTDDLATAEARAELIRGTLLKDLSPYTQRNRHIAYLARVVAAGEKAKAELVDLLTSSNVVRIEHVEGVLTAVLDGTLSKGSVAAWRAFLRNKPAHLRTIRDVSPEIARRYLAEVQRKRGDADARAACKALAEIHGAVDPNGPNPWRLAK